MDKKENNSLVKVGDEYSEKSFFDKIVKVAKTAGIKVIYTGLLLYYALLKPDIPKKIKGIIIGALGYFILPLDFVSDIIPVAGYVDDLGILVGALIMVAMYIDDEVKEKAREKLRDWFGNFDQDELSEIDEKLNKDN